jgi:hypothetical protein
MARIITYEDDPNISDLDRLIGSDGNDYNITKNFTLLGIAEYVIDVFVNPDATDFHIPVFNSNGTRITDSIMHQDSSPSNGVPGTIITVDGNFSVVGNTVLGTTVDNTTIVPSTLRIRGKVSDKSDNFGVANQILMSDENGYVQWGPECGQGFVLGQGTLHYLPLWTPDSGTIGDSLVYQNGDNDTPATEIYFKGGLASEGSKVANITDIALGNKNFAGGEGSAAFNFRSIALGNDAFASGHRGVSGGHGSFTAGYNVGAGNDGFGLWNADYTDATVLELTLISGNINQGDYLIANTGDDPSAKIEILSVQYPTNTVPYEITIATPISVNLDQAFAIETANPDRGDQQATVAIGFQSASKGFGAAAIGYDAVADAAGALALGKDALADQTNQVAIGSGNVKLDGTTQDDTQDKVLVIDANTSIVRYRSALTISPELGWDTVDYSTGNQNWIVDKYNGYMEIPFGVIPPAKREIRPNGLTTGEEGYFVFVANSADIPADFLDFTSINSGNINRVRTTWSGSGTRTYIPNNQNNGKWITGTAVKFHYIVREEAGVTTIWWDACCEIQALNDCPVITSPSVSHTINEDQAFSGGLPATDGDGPLALAWSIVDQPDNGSVSLNTATGDYTYTPNSNYFGSDSFTWQVFDGGCYSAVGTVNFTIDEIIEYPAFKISNGLGNNCGADDVAPLYTGTAGGSYVWEGHYCDPDHAASDVTITTFYDVGGTWTPGLPANWTFTKDFVSGVAVDYRFTLESSNVASGLTRIKLEIEDVQGNEGTPYILEIGAAFDTLTKTEILLDYSGALPANSNVNGNWIYPGVTYDNIWDGKKMENLITDTYDGYTPNQAATANNVTPSGGTLAALYPSATFTITKMQSAVALEFYYSCSLDSGALSPTSNNIDPGLTIEFNAATLDAAFGLPPNTSTGSLIWELEVEDILRAPLATGDISNISSNLAPQGHNCNDGGFALIAWGYDTAGTYHSFLLRRFDIANSGGVPYQHQGAVGSQFFSKRTWTPPYAYISTPAPVTGQCTTPAATSTWWQRSGSGWQLDDTDVDETNAGAIWDKQNNLANLPNQSGTGQNNYSYIPADQYNWYSAANNSTAGLYRMDSATAATVASTITSGKINFMVVGLGFANGQQSNGTPATCDPTKEYQAWLHGDACQMRIFTENAGGTNQIEVKDGANSFLAGDGKYVEIDVYATPGSNATVFSF